MHTLGHKYMYVMNGLHTSACGDVGGGRVIEVLAVGTAIAAATVHLDSLASRARRALRRIGTRRA